MKEITGTDESEKSTNTSLFQKISKIFLGESGFFRFDTYLKRQILKTEATPKQLEASLSFARWAESVFKNLNYDNFEVVETSYKITNKDLLSIVEIAKQRENIRDFADQVFKLIDPSTDAFPSVLNKLKTLLDLQNIDLVIGTLNELNDFIIAQPSQDVYVNPEEKGLIKKTWKNDQWVILDEPITTLAKMNTENIGQLFSSDNKEFFKQFMSLLQKKVDSNLANNELSQIDVDLIPTVFKIIANPTLKKVLFNYLDRAHAISYLDIERIIISIPYLAEGFPEIILLSESGFEVSNWASNLLSNSTLVDLARDGATSQEWREKALEKYPHYTSLKPITNDEVFCENVQLLSNVGIRIDPHYNMDDESTTPKRKPFFYETKPSSEIELIAAFYENGFDKLGFNLIRNGYFADSQTAVVNKNYDDFAKLFSNFSTETIRSRMAVIPDNFFLTLHRKETTDLLRNESFLLLKKILAFNSDSDCKKWVDDITSSDVLDSIHGQNWLTEYAAASQNQDVTSLSAKLEYFFSDLDVSSLNNNFQLTNEQSTELLSFVDELRNKGVMLAFKKLENVIRLSKYSAERRKSASALCDELFQLYPGQESFSLRDQDFELIDTMSKYSDPELSKFYEVLQTLGKSKADQIKLLFKGGYQIATDTIESVFENSEIILSGISQLQTLIPDFITSQSLRNISENNFSDYIDNLIIIGNHLDLVSTIKRICMDHNFDFDLDKKNNARSLLEISRAESTPDTELLSIAKGLKDNAHYFSFDATDVHAFATLKQNPDLLDSVYTLGQKTNYIFHGRDINDLLQNKIDDPKLVKFIIDISAIYPNHRFEAVQAHYFSEIEDRDVVIEFLKGLRSTNYNYFADDLSVIETIAKDEKLNQFCLSLFKAGVIFSKYEIEAYVNLMVKNQEVLAFVQENPQQALTLSHNLHHFKSGVPENISSFLTMVRDIETSQSQDIRTLKEQLITQLKKSKNPDSAWREIESVFIKNHLPLVGKIFKIFEILYPPDTMATLLDSTSLKEHKITSPTLRQAGNQRRRYIIYRDLLNAHIRSGNRSLEQYIDILLSGEQVCNKFEQEGFSSLNETELMQLTKFFDRAEVLYTNSALGLFKPKELPLLHEGDTNKSIDEESCSRKLTELKRVMGVADHETLFDRITQMYAAPLGKTSIQEIQAEMHSAISEANQRGLDLYQTAQTNGGKLDLTAGDFLKAINEEYYHLIAQNGSVSQEFLGSSARSDSTPFDTDLSIIPENHLVLPSESKQSVFAHILDKSSSGPGIYGNLVLVMKDRDQFNHTDVKSESVDLPKIGASSIKLEIFQTGVVGDTHYGIRTGFPITDVDFMIFGSNMEPKNRNKVLLEIAKNGYYIPITDEEGNIIFTPDQYNQLRTVFAGIPYLSSESVEIDLLSTKESLELKQEIDILSQSISENREILEKQHSALVTIIHEILVEQQIDLFDEHSGSALGAELENIGSTSRFTSTIGDHDYDFALFMDTLDYNKRQKIYDSLVDRLQPTGKVFLGDPTFSQLRFKNVTYPGLNGVDIDMGMIPKNQERGFASHTAVSLKLESILESYGQAAYESVISNIVLAKQWLKENNAYGQADGFFGGIAIENLIVQYKGNIVNAFSTFVSKADASRSYEQFRKEFQLWNPGTNARSSDHNDLIEMMTEEGFNKTVVVMKAFLEKYEVQTSY